MEQKDRILMDKRERPSFFKRVYFVMPDFQISFLSQVSIIALVIVVIFHLIEAYSLERIFQLEKNPNVSLEDLYLMLRHQMNIIFSLKSFTLIVALLIWGLFFSHRIAGPVWRVLRLMEQMIQGQKPGNFSLRKNDYFKELADKLEKIYQDQDKP